MARTRSIGAVGRITRGSTTAPETAATYANASVDFVYVDTAHTFTHTRDELALWWPKVRRGGWLCGDDLCRPGVRAAVDAFFGPERVFYWGQNQFCVGADAAPKGRALRLLATREKGPPCVAAERLRRLWEARTNRSGERDRLTF